MKLFWPVEVFWNCTFISPGSGDTQTSLRAHPFKWRCWVHVLSEGALVYHFTGFRTLKDHVKKKPKVILPVILLIFVSLVYEKRRVPFVGLFLQMLLLKLRLILGWPSRQSLYLHSLQEGSSAGQGVLPREVVGLPAPKVTGQGETTPPFESCLRQPPRSTTA